MIFRASTIAALALLAAGCAGQEDSFRRGVSYDPAGVHIVPAGRTITLSESYLTMDQFCRLKPGPRITFPSPPKHGRASAGVGGLSTPNFAQASHKHCNDTLTRATIIKYTPAPGYRGPDALTARVRFQDGEVRMESFRIEVR